MAERILVINPNSSEIVTRGIDAALEPLRMDGGPVIECRTLQEGPPGIQTQRDIEQVTLPLARMIEGERDAAAFVIACFSDPGIHLAREATRRPVFGISEAGITTALNLGNAIGIIAILQSAVRRHQRYFRALGLSSRIAGDRPVDMGVAELADEERTLRRMTEVGQQLRDEDGADVLVMGCAGMARYRAELERALGIPVVDPTQAAVGMAITAVQIAGAALCGGAVQDQHRHVVGARRSGAKAD
jgi:Asp/Glu/hydantoin racemase